MTKFSKTIKVFDVQTRAKQAGITLRTQDIVSVDLDSCSDDLHWVLTGERRDISMSDVVLELRDIYAQITHRLATVSA